MTSENTIKRNPRDWIDLRGLNVILIEADAVVASRLLAAIAEAGGGSFVVTHFRNLDECVGSLQDKPADAVVVDLTTLDGNPVRSVEALRECAVGAAIIVLTSENHERMAVEALHAGAQDFLVMEQLTVDALARSLCGAVERQRMLQQLRDRLDRLEAEEARFRTIVETTTDGIVIVDPTGQISFVNPAAETLFGRSARDLIESPFGFPVVVGATTEIDLVRPDGTVTVAELRVAESQWEGRPAAIASLRDITERRMMEERERSLMREQAARAAAEASEQRARFLAEVGSVLADSLDHRQSLRSLAELVVPFLADWCIVDLLETDGSMQRIAVVNADPAKAAAAQRLASFTPDPTALLGSARALRTGQPQLITDITDDFLRRLTSRDDYWEAMRAVEPRSALIVPLVARGRALGTIVLIVAASGRHYSEQDLKFAEELARRAAITVDNARLYQEAQAANRSKADFLAVMSHELRTPLNAVIGYADLLLMGVPVPVPAAIQTQIQRIRSSARHLLRLIEEILAYARMEAGREELELDNIDVIEFMRDLRTIVEPMAEDKRLQLMIDLPDAPVRLRTDAGKLQQILVNLLSNAIKFTETGKVGLSFDVDSGVAEFRVWDTGIGIQPELVSRIFEPFWQVEPSRTRRAGGTGLGLTVARRLARLLGGDIEVHSKPNFGSEFVVRIAPSLTKPAG